jgi:hypothetical protein
MSRTKHVIEIASLLLILILVSIPLAAQGTTEVFLSWPPNPEPDILRYIIYRSPDTLTAHFVAIDSVASSTVSYTDGGLDKGIPYFYRVKAKSSTGETSPFSNNVSILCIPQDATDALKALCRISSVVKVGAGIYDVSWSTAEPTIGFVQYGGTGGFDDMSGWDDATYRTAHTARIEDLPTSGTFLIRAASYDDQKNMFVSATDTVVATPDNPAPLTAPALSAYPVPYHPGMGIFQVDNIPAGGSVTVYAESGLEVWHGETGGGTSLQWDGTNSDGSRVMSGVYYLVVKDAGGNVYEKRPIMIVNK